MKIKNSSSSANLYVATLAIPAATDPDPAAATAVVAPGQSGAFADNPQGMRTACYLYRGGGPSQRQLFWKGLVRPGVTIGANPDAGDVHFADVALSDGDLQAAKSLFEAGSPVHDVTLQQIQQHATTRDPPGRLAVAVPRHGARDPAFSDCDLAVVSVVLDVFALAFGMPGLIEKVDYMSLQAVGRIVGEEGLSDIRQMILAFQRQPTTYEKVKFAIAVIEKIGKDNVPNIVRAIVGSLSVWDTVLYSSIALTHVSLFFLTDGVWLVAALVFEITANTVILLEDILKAIHTCNPGAPALSPAEPGQRHIRNPNGRRLVPSSQPHDPSVLMPLEVGTYRPADSDAWQLEPFGNAERTYFIRNVSMGGYVKVAPQAASALIVAARSTGPEARWIASPAPASSSFPLFYYLDSATGLGSMYIDRGRVEVVVRRRDATNSGDSLFAWTDEPTQPAEGTNAMKIHWKLELDFTKNGWNFWNGYDNQGMDTRIPFLEGTIDKPDSQSYMCVVTMARSSSTSQGIAQVISWSDAGGKHIKARFDARGKWAKDGNIDGVESVVDAWNDGVRLTARILV